jgi:CopG-like RHH_1 or ribbon-helix-helix domain, RHH_5
VSETPDDVWESDDSVRRTIVIPTELAERLAAEAERRGLTISELLIEYAQQGLQRRQAET